MSTVFLKMVLEIILVLGLVGGSLRIQLGNITRITLNIMMMPL